MKPFLSIVVAAGFLAHAANGAGNYLTVWRRGASGAWQISRNLAM